MATSMRKYLFQFANEHLEFRLPEFTSVANLFGIELKYVEDYNVQSPFVVVELESEEDAKRIANRTVTLKSMCELWASGETHDQLISNLRCLSSELISRCLNTERSYRIQVNCFNRQLSQQDKINRIESLLDCLKCAGKLNLSDNCDDTYRLLEHYERDGADAKPKASKLYFGRWICDGHRVSVGKFSLNKRCFISNTSMDPTLSMIMSNMAKVKNGTIVSDPFVGSGSLLVSAAHFGAYVMGSDIDVNLLMGVGKSSRAGQKWRYKSENVHNNLKQYNNEAKYLDIVIADASTLLHLHRPHSFLDAIITDPPYGIREPTMKIGSKHKMNEASCDIDSNPNAVKSTTNYLMTDILRDLLKFASVSLVIGGRLVFWIPVVREDYLDTQLPSHPCLRLIANSEQILNQRVSRRLLTMEKFKHPNDDDIAQVSDSLGSEHDHYAESSFRDRYFNPGVKTNKNQQQDSDN